MAHIFRPTAVKPIPRGAVIRTIKGVPHALWTNRLGKPVLARLTDDGAKCCVQSPTWWIEYTDEKGNRQRVKGFKNRAATFQHAASLEKLASDTRGGIVAPRTKSPTNIGDHLHDFREHLEGKGNGKPHIESVMHNVKAVVVGLKLRTPATVDCDKVDRWLTSERKREGWSEANRNRYVIFLRMFGKWLVKSKRSQFNPFEQLCTVKTNGERTRTRRRLSDDELQLLIDAARTSNVSLLSLPGPDRARLYRMAAFTGLRIGSLSKLIPEAFTWIHGSPATITASARIVKNKKSHTIPVHPDLAAELADWLLNRPAGKPIFPAGNWKERGANLVAHDLGVARLAWIAKGRTAKERAVREASDILKRMNAAGEVFDFHALRVQFISSLALAGVPLTAAQQLADHSTPSLTANIYTRWGKSEMSEQVAKLPGWRKAS